MDFSSQNGTHRSGARHTLPCDPSARLCGTTLVVARNGVALPGLEPHHAALRALRHESFVTTGFVPGDEVDTYDAYATEIAHIEHVGDGDVVVALARIIPRLPDAPLPIETALPELFATHPAPEVGDFEISRLRSKGGPAATLALFAGVANFALEAGLGSGFGMIREEVSGHLQRITPIEPLGAATQVADYPDRMVPVLIPQTLIQAFSKRAA